MRAVDRTRYQLVARSREHARRRDEARRSLDRAVREGPLVVMFSGGADSSALADLALQHLGPVTLCRLASPYPLPGWEAVDAFFAARTTLHVEPPARDLAETIAWLREVGLGCDRVTMHSRDRANRQKRDRGTTWALEHGFRAQALGMRAEESQKRRRLAAWIARDERTYLAHGLRCAIPLADWSRADVWAYLVAEGVPWHPLYDHETHGYTHTTLRNTGWLTTIDAPEGRLGWLRQHYRAQYEALTAAFPHLAGMR